MIHPASARSHKGVEVLKKVRELCFVEELAYEVGRGLIVLFMRIGPTRVQFGFLERLVHITHDAFDILVARGRPRGQRPGAHQGLVEQVLLVGIRGRHAIELGLVRLVPVLPADDRRGPLLGRFRKHIQPCPQSSPRLVSCVAVASMENGQVASRSALRR